MGKKVVYRFIDGQRDDDAPIIFTEGGRGSTTEMDLVQTRDEIPEVIQKDQLVFDRQHRTFWVGNGAGTPQQVSDIRIFSRFGDLPAQGIENCLYIALQDNIFSVYVEGQWKRFSMSPVTVAQYYGVSTFKDKTEFPAIGEENHIYLTEDGFGYAWVTGKGYVNIFGDKTWSWTKDESDARFAFKSDIPASKTLNDLGGITPHDVDLKIQDAKDEADTKFATISDNDLKADKTDVYTKTEADDKFLNKKDKPTLSSLGAISTEIAENTFLKKAPFDALKKDVETVQNRINTISEYAKTTEMQKAVDDSAASIRKDLQDDYMLKADIEKELSQKADAVSVMKKTDMAPYALKGDIPTLTKLGGVSRAEIESTYVRKTNLEALKDTYYPKTDIDTKFADVYTKKDADAKLKEALPKEPWTDFAKKSDLTKDFAVKSETYTKEELDGKLKSIEAHGVDLSGYLKQGDDDSDKYLDDRIDGRLPDMTKYQAKDGLLKEVIQQDKAKGNDLMLDYFANKDDIQSLELSRSRLQVDHGILTVEKDGDQFIAITTGVMQRPELPIGHNPIKLFVNGVRYTEGTDFSYDKETNRLQWLHTEEDGYFRITSDDELRVEYETPAAKPKAPTQSESSTDKDAVKIAIAQEDLDFIRDCTAKASTSESNAKTSEQNADASAKAAAASEAKAAADAKSIEDTKTALQTGIDDVKTLAQSAQDKANFATPKVLNITLAKDAWKDGAYTVNCEYIRARSMLFLDLQSVATDEQKEAFGDAFIEADSQWNGTVMLRAQNVPAIDIPARFIILPEEAA